MTNQVANGSYLQNGSRRQESYNPYSERNLDDTPSSHNSAFRGNCHVENHHQEDDSDSADVPFDVARVDSTAERGASRSAFYPSQHHREVLSLKGPRYSDPSTMRVVEGKSYEDPALDQEGGFEEAIEKVEDFSRMMDQRRTAHYTQTGYNQWERVDNSNRHAGGFENDSDHLADEQDPFLGLEGDEAEEIQAPILLHNMRHDTQHPLDDPDETSIDEPAKPSRRSPSNLQERTQQAWKSRQRKNSFHKKSSRSRDSQEYLPESLRSKSEKSISIHDKSANELPQDDKSLNSEYTKTVESEVEDLIKDVLFIGNPHTSQPGRRKYKFKHEVKKRLKNQEDLNKGERETVDETDDVEKKILTDARVEEGKNAKVRQVTFQEELPVSRKRGHKAKKKKKKNINAMTDLTDAETALWNFVEGGMNVVSSALGLTDDTQPKTTRPGTGVDNDVLCADPLFPFDACTGPTRIGPSDNSRRDMSHSISYAQSQVYAQLAEADQLQGSRDLQDFGERFHASNSNESSEGSHFVTTGAKGSEDNLTRAIDSSRTKPSFNIETLSDNDQVRQLAVHAAKALHQSQGVVFDETYIFSLEEDFQISVVELKLPLGLIFQENEGGCCVTKVDRHGSAARSGGVEVGDQLTAVNGTISLNMKVEELSKIVLTSSDPKRVELVFLRYIGPFCPDRRARLPDEVIAYDVDMSRAHDAKYVSASTNPRANNPKRKGLRLFARGKK